MDNASARLLNNSGPSGPSGPTVRPPENRPAPVDNDRSSDSGRRGEKRKKSNLKRNVIGGVVLIIIAVITVGIFMFNSVTGIDIDSSKYQAVFLTNGQVYFGKLQAFNGGNMKLTDIWYLQSKTDNSSTKGLQDTSATTDVNLIKLGNEIHGPTDEMVINKDQILFFENLKPDGSVVKSIIKEKSRK